MKIACLLQNSWGGRCAMLFRPNPFNKSARTMQKICGDNVVYFCNTTLISTPTSKGKAPIDPAHMGRLIPMLKGQDIIIVCGKQAGQAYEMFKQEFKNLQIPVIFMQHPASRTLTNKEKELVRSKILKLQKS